MDQHSKVTTMSWAMAIPSTAGSWHFPNTARAPALENGKIGWELMGVLGRKLETETCNWEINTSYDNCGSSLRKGGGWTELSIDSGKSSVKFNIPWRHFLQRLPGPSLGSCQNQTYEKVGMTTWKCWRRITHSSSKLMLPRRGSVPLEEEHVLWFCISHK